MTRGNGSKDKPADVAQGTIDPSTGRATPPVPPPPPPKQEITVQHIEQVDPPPPPQGSDQVIEMNPDPIGSGSGSAHKAQPPHTPPHAPHEQQHHVVRPPPPPPPPVDHTKDPKKPDPLTRDQVGAKLSAARREYATYKDKFGERLDNQWNDLQVYLQYHPNDLDEIGHRIDAFRVRMHE
jgi:hypothetical protein